MGRAPARHDLWGRALSYLLYDLVALLPWNRPRREQGLFIGKEVLNTDPHGVYVTVLAQEVGTGFLVSADAKADGGRPLFETSEVCAALLAFHGPTSGSVHFFFPSSMPLLSPTHNGSWTQVIFSKSTKFGDFEKCFFFSMCDSERKTALFKNLPESRRELKKPRQGCTPHRCNFER